MAFIFFSLAPRPASASTTCAGRCPAHGSKAAPAPRHHQAFITYLYRLPITGLSIKAVYGFALASIQDLDTRSAWNNQVHSFRVRISYEFN